MTNDPTAAWAATAIRQGREAGGAVRYGDPEWLQLPAGDPRRFAGLVIAAEAWRQEFEPPRVRERLDEFAVMRAEVRDELAAEEAASWSEVAKHVRSWANRPTAAELTERRREETAGRVDYPGRVGGVTRVNFATGRHLGEGPE